MNGQLFETARGPIVFVMLNPSTADGTADDPTLRRCLGFAQDLGAGGGMADEERGAVITTCGRYRLRLWRMHGALRVVNLYAWRSSSPDEMYRRAADGADIIGPDNDAEILCATRGAEVVIAAWGADKRARGRAAAVAAMLSKASRDLHVLGPGKPQHPLYLPRSARPVRWTP